MAQEKQDSAKSCRQIRAAFFDIDGTLAEEGTHRLPESTRMALAQLRRKGITVLLATGRHPLEIQEENLVPDLEYDGGIYSNGQICELQGRPVHQSCLPMEALRGLKDYLKRHGRSCIFMERHRMYCNLVDDRMVAEQARIGTAVPPVENLEGLEHREILQVIPFIDASEEAVLLAAMPGCVLFRWGASVVDINSCDCGKDAGMEHICRALGITLEQTIAFGDAHNDLAMLRRAAIGVAMGNATPEVKAEADYVTDCVGEDGILHALRHFGLLE